MRTKQLYPGINNSQKIRVILNGVGIYTTVAATQGIFATTLHQLAVEAALLEISKQKGVIIGYASRWCGIDFQVDFI
jgi:hypothetical protein